MSIVQSQSLVVIALRKGVVLWKSWYYFNYIIAAKIESFKVSKITKLSITDTEVMEKFLENLTSTVAH